MAFVNTGLNNRGQTRNFNVFYDDSLSSARGVELASELMDHCDSDFAWLNTFFPGVTLGVPMDVKIANVATAAEVGASWSGWGPVRVGIELDLGEISIIGGTPLELARYLLVVECSEIFMRERQPAWFNRFNDWFEAFDEGSKGESLSLVLGVQFLRDNLSKLTMIPAVPGFNFEVSSVWLNGVRDNTIDVNIDDINHDDITGCGTLFLFFLHDQLGFGWADIIANGGRTLADVYSHLTGDDRANAFPTFADLVNLHYPLGVGVSYFPNLETVFPVPSLRLLLAPSQVSWVSNGPPQPVQVVFDQLATVRTPAMLSSDDPATASVPGQVILPIGSAVVGVPLQVPVPPHPDTFPGKTVTLTADYAGQELTCEIQVVRPQDLVLPALEIDVVSAGDPCAEVFAEGSALTLAVKNSDVIASHAGLRYEWAVSGAVPAAYDTPQLSIPALPPAGTKVSVDVVITNALMIHAQGHYEFVVAAQLKGLAELERLVRCRVAGLKQLNVFIPPWIPVEVEAGPLQEQHLELIEERTVILSRELRKTATLISQLREARVAESSRS